MTMSVERQRGDDGKCERGETLRKAASRGGRAMPFFYNARCYGNALLTFCENKPE